MHQTFSKFGASVSLGALALTSVPAQAVVFETINSATPGVTTGTFTSNASDLGNSELSTPSMLTIGSNVYNYAAILNAGSTFIAEIDGRTYSLAGGAGSYDRIIQTGPAGQFQPGGTIVPTLRGLTGSANNNFTPVYGDSFTVVTADRIGTGSFTITQPTAGMPANSRFDLVYNSTSIQLIVTPRSYAAAGINAGWRGNAISAGAGLDGYRPAAGARNGGRDDVLFAALYSQSAGQLENVFASLSGEAHAQAQHASAETVRAALHSVRGTIAHRSDTDGSLWMNFIRHSSDQKADSYAGGYSSSSDGYVLGFDFVNNTKLRIGVAGSYADGKLRTDADAKSGNKAFGGYLYGSLGIGRKLEVAATAGYAGIDIDTTRRVSIGTISSTISSKRNAKTWMFDFDLRYGIIEKGGFKAALTGGVELANRKFGPSPRARRPISA